MSFILSAISQIMIPLVIFIIIGYGVLMRKNIFQDFLTGAEEGFHTVIRIMPTLIGLMVAVGILRASGFLGDLSVVLGKFTGTVGIPSAVVPLLLIRMFSSSAANSMVTDLFKNYHPDSYIGTLTSILMSCTETIFYTVTVYFGMTKVKKTRWVLPGALISMAAGIIASVILASYCK